MSAPFTRLTQKRLPEGTRTLSDRITICNANRYTTSNIKMAAAVGNAPTYQVLQTCANLSQLSSEQRYRDERTRTSGKLVPKTSAIATRRHPVKRKKDVFLSRKPKASHLNVYRFCYHVRAPATLSIVKRLRESTKIFSM